MAIEEPKTKTGSIQRKLFAVQCHHSAFLIHTGPCVIGNVVITSSSGAGYVDVYDGVNALGDHKFHLRCIQDTTFSTGAAQDHYFEKGLYIVPDSITTHAMVTWYPLEFK